MQITLHLGAHKTASTYLQRCLAHSGNVLEEHKVRFMGPKLLRPLLRSAQKETNGSIGRRQVRYDALVREVDAAQDAGVERLILSDEQFLGSLRGLVSGEDFYEHVRDHLAPVFLALEGRRANVLLSIRNYADFLASAYGQVLRGWKYIPFDPAMRRSFLAQSRGWLDLIEDIEALMPSGSAVHVWEYERLASLEAEVFDALRGSNRADVLRLPIRPHQSPSQTSVDFLSERASLGLPIDSEIVRSAIRKAHKKDGHPAFDPWSVAERDYLESRYREDLKVLWQYRKVGSKGLMLLVDRKNRKRVDGPRQNAAFPH